MSKKNAIPKGAITERQLRKLLKADAKGRSYSEWATAHKMTPQVISAFMRRVQSPGLQIPAALGYFPQVVYLPTGSDPITTPNPPRRITDRPTSKVDHTKPPIEKKGYKEPDKKKNLKKRAKGKK